MSFFRLAEQYFALVRRISRLHSTILDKFSDDINALVETIDTKMQTYGNKANLSNTELLEFRSLIFRLQDLLDIKVMDEYNSLLDKVNTENTKKEDRNVDNNGIEANINPENVWESLKHYLESKMNNAAFSVWVKPAQFMSVEDGKIKVKVDNFFYKRFLEENCSPLIRKYIDENKLPYDVSFVA